MTQGILPPPSPNVFSLLRICPSCWRPFALQPIDVKREEGLNEQVLRCKHCGKETTRPERRPPGCV